jgi:hypothetical protein
MSDDAHVVRFLCDPIASGAYCARLTVPYATLMELYTYCSNLSKEKRRRLKIEKPENDREFFKFMSSSGYPDFIDKTLDTLLNFLVKFDDKCPKEVKDWSEYGNTVVFPLYYSENEPELNKDDYNFFFGQQCYFEDITDALSIQIDDKAGPDFVAEIGSLTPKVLAKFRDFVSSIPCFKGKIIFKNEGQQHTQGSVYNLYPAVLGLWVDTFAHRNVKRDTIEYLSQALTYIDKKEWRMVIILSALSAEGLLADIYEDLFREESPEEPLGALIDDINKKRKLPPDVYKNLNTLNNVRNGALHHKGLTTLTRKEALLSLSSATKFSLWWSFNSVDLCENDVADSS